MKRQEGDRDMKGTTEERGFYGLRDDAHISVVVEVREFVEGV